MPFMRGWIAIVLVFAAMLAGCISTEMTHVQHADGGADITQTTDMSALSSLGASDSSYGSAYSEALSSSLETVCDKYEEGVACSQEDGTVTLKKHFRATDAFYKFEVKDEIFVKKYRLTVDRIESLGDVSSSSLAANTTDSAYSSPYGTSLGSYGDLGADDTVTLTSSRSKMIGNLLEQMKMEYTYTIRMPGKISEAQGAVSQNESEATFDLIKQMQDRKPIVVMSEEVNWPLVLIAGIFGFMGIVLAALGVMLMLKPKQV
jgi:hypothetical protein